MNTILLLLSLLIIALLVVNLVITASKKPQDNTYIVNEIDKLQENLIEVVGFMKSNQTSSDQQMTTLRQEVTNALRESRKELYDQQGSIAERQQKTLTEISKYQNDNLKEMKEEIHSSTVVQKESFSDMQKVLYESFEKNTKNQTEVLTNLQKSMSDSMLKTQETVSKTLQDVLNNLQESNEKKLDEIRGVVNEKLDKTLNERLDSNFKSISENLSKLYESLGNLKNLETGVDSLNKTLTNVKARGTWGEVQLERILEQTLTKGQYKKNYATKKGSSELVEFAVCLPSDDKNDCAFLPIDSKFPADIYNHIVEASESGDASALVTAQKELKDRLKGESIKIRDKYLDPPHTSDFAIMFLPTEGLYAEALRIDGIVDYCQSNNVVIAGPTTITALLNIIAVGFRNAALNKETAEVRKLLEAVKGQITSLDEIVEKAQKKIDDASTATRKISDRTRIMKKKMGRIGTMDPADSNQLLGIEEITTYDSDVE